MIGINMALMLAFTKLQLKESTLKIKKTSNGPLFRKQIFWPLQQILSTIRRFPLSSETFILGICFNSPIYLNHLSRYILKTTRQWILEWQWEYKMYYEPMFWPRNCLSTTEKIWTCKIMKILLFCTNPYTIFFLKF